MMQEKYTQSRASDVISEDAIKRYRAFAEDLAAIGGHIAYATHDEMHVVVPEGRKAEGDALMERYLSDYVSAVMSTVMPPASLERDIVLGGDFVCDNIDPKQCTGCQAFKRLLRGEK